MTDPLGDVEHPAWKLRETALRAETVDVSGWCVTDGHATCPGLLLSGTGYHWWCACSCHPDDMVREPAPRTVNHKAWTVWRAARSKP